MASRFEKFSERARRVLSLAQEEAQRLQQVSQGQAIGVGDVSGTGVETFTGEEEQGLGGGTGQEQPPTAGVLGGVPA